MPASLTRECPACRKVKDRADFRDIGQTIGRPPKVCRACREAVPALQAAYLYNHGRRHADNAAQHRYAARPFDEVLDARDRIHPDGRKVCPEVSGCGEPLPFSAYGPGLYRADGLAPLCLSCFADHKALGVTAP